MRRALVRVLTYSAFHFLIAMAFAILTYGTDLDQLRSRSSASRAAGYVYDLLWYPHDAIIRAIPHSTLLKPGIIPVVLIAASLLWGWTAYLVLATAPSLRRRFTATHSPPRLTSDHKGRQ